MLELKNVNFWFHLYKAKYVVTFYSVLNSISSMLKTHILKFDKKEGHNFYIPYSLFILILKYYLKNLI